MYEVGSPLDPLQRVRTLTRAGNLQSLNQLAADARANYIIHTGDFGFYDDRSLDRIADKYVHAQMPCPESA